MIEHLWATPINRGTMPEDIVQKLSTRILLDYDMTTPPTEIGRQNILQNNSPEFKEFKEKVVYPAFNELLTETLGRTIDSWGDHTILGWLTGSGAGYNINYHNHKGSQLTAVFYIICDETAGGEITFTDPRQNANRGYDLSFTPWFKDLRFAPKSGDFIVFPSYLYHFVETYKSNVRVAIPVDLFLRTNK